MGLQRQRGAYYQSRLSLLLSGLSLLLSGLSLLLSEMSLLRDGSPPGFIAKARASMWTCTLLLIHRLALVVVAVVLVVENKNQATLYDMILILYYMIARCISVVC